VLLRIRRVSPVGAKTGVRRPNCSFGDVRIEFWHPTGSRPGDIIFFGHDDGPSGHAALWLSNDQIVQCSASGNGSNIRPLAGYVAPTGWVRWNFNTS
jgi:cell wall-associated NlpC family hydrolase